MPMPSVPKNYNVNGGRNRGNENKAMRKTSLKEMYIVRYADDFKIFCSNKRDADKIFIAVTKWLKERLKLDVSPEKSKVVNLRKSYTEFLGFKLKVVPNKGKYKVRSHMSEKAITKTKSDLLAKIKELEHPSDSREVHKLVGKYNSMIIGKHLAYRIATNVYMDMDKMAFQLNNSLKIRMKGRLKKNGIIPKGYIKDTYGKSKQIRFLDGYPLVPIAYIRTKNALHLKRGVCNYTVEGRTLIHKPLGVNLSILRELMEEEISDASIEFMDNRISLYAAQNGKCAILGDVLRKEEIYCHHKIPFKQGGTDQYENLVIVSEKLMELLISNDANVIAVQFAKFHLNDKQIRKINNIRKSAKLEPIE